MLAQLEEPIFTEVLPDTSDLDIPPNAVFITGISCEERSRHCEDWECRRNDVRFVHITSQDPSKIRLNISGKEDEEIILRSSRQLSDFLKKVTVPNIYLDITGLAHHVWAPLVKAARIGGIPTKIVYVEPGDYRSSSTPTEGAIFDLSEKISGLAPLPGFVALSREMDEDALFVPLLGFEGTRLAYMLENVQPQRNNIYPIIGTPGFRPQYPFFTYLGNKTQLLETRAWKNVRYARANCPFSVYGVLERLVMEYPRTQLKIAPIGTKPHALGAVLFYIDHPAIVELIYDHPIRKAKRTEGKSRVCIYDLSLLGPVRTDRRMSSLDTRSRAYP